MKKISITFAFLLLLNTVFAAEKISNPEIKFIKGNIQDKIESIKDDSDNTYKIAEKALNFVIDNIELLKDDRDIAGLAIAAVYSFPEEKFLQEPSETVIKFESLFYTLSDENVKISILDKFLTLSEKTEKTECIDAVNKYLKAAYEDKIELAAVQKKAVNVASLAGNSTSFSILYDIYKNNTWASYNKEIKNALISLADKSVKDLMIAIKNADFEEMKVIYSIFVEDSAISSTLKSEIAENLLSNSMILVRDSSKISKDLSDFQLKNCNILYQNNWTRSSALIISYFNVAKTEFNAGFLTDDDFAKVISFTEKTASKESVKVLTEYLEELNKEMENGNLPAVNVVSAVIQALGTLGDKSAFDCLLFTTYLNYPEEIVAQARRSLSSLKW